MSILDEDAESLRAKYLEMQENFKKLQNENATLLTERDKRKVVSDALRTVMSDKEIGENVKKKLKTSGFEPPGKSKQELEDELSMIKNQTFKMQADLERKNDLMKKAQINDNLGLAPNEEVIGQIERYANENSIGNYEVAAKLYRNEKGSTKTVKSDAMYDVFEAAKQELKGKTFDFKSTDITQIAHEAAKVANDEYNNIKGSDFKWQ